MNEQNLIDQFLHNGDHAALVELIEPYEQRLFRYLWQILHQRQDCEDAVQETVRKVVCALPNYQDRGQFKSWLFRIAHNAGLDLLRRRKRSSKLHDEAIDQLEPTPEMNPEPSSVLIAKERHRELAQAVDRLPEVEREVVRMRFFADLSFKEISEVLGAPIGTVLARMHRAKNRLRDQLQPAQL